MALPPMDPLAKWMAGTYNTGVNSVVGPQSWLGKNAGYVVGGTLGDIGSAVSNDTGDRMSAIGQDIGSSLPRTAAGIAAGTLTGTGPVPLMADSATETYDKTGSVGKAALVGAANALPMGGAKLGGDMAEEWALKKAAQSAIPGELTEASVIPKVAGTLGGAAVGQEAQRQTDLTAQGVAWNDPARNPASVHNMVAQLFGAGMYGANELVGHGDSWWKDQEYNPKTGSWQSKPAYPIGAGSTPGDVNSAVAPSGPDWRHTYAKDGLDDISATQDPTDRQQKVSKLTDMVYNTSNIENLGDSTEQQAKMVYAAPPTDSQGLVDLAKRVNTIQADALRMMDEKASAGEEGATSSAAYRQLKSQGWITQEITHDWLKTEFGKGVDRSLANSNANAYLMLTQKLANRMFLIADAAKTMRDQTPVDTQESAKTTLDKATTFNFFDAVGKIPDKGIRDQLYDRFNFHEGLDNRQDTGSSKPFMEDITHIVNHISSTTPDDQVGWRFDSAPFMKAQKQTDDAGNEIRPASSVMRNLDWYLQKDDAGRYVNPVYGRSNRSQRELIASQMGDEGTTHQGPRETDAKQDLVAGTRSNLAPDEEFEKGGSAPATPTDSRFENIPASEGLGSGNKMDDIADSVRGHIAKSTDSDLWSTIAPEFKNSRGFVHPILAGRIQPIAKDFTQAVFELGAKGQGGANVKADLSPAGQRVADALGVKPGLGRSMSSQLSQKMNDIFKSGGRDPNQVRQGIIRRVAQEAGIGGPQQVSNRPSDPSPSGSYQLKTWVDDSGDIQPAHELAEEPTIGVDTVDKRLYLGRDNAAQHFKDLSDGRMVFKDDEDMYYVFDPKTEVLQQTHEMPVSGPVTNTPQKGTPNYGVGGNSTLPGDSVTSAIQLYKPFFYGLGMEPDLANRFTLMAAHVAGQFATDSVMLGKVNSSMAYDNISNPSFENQKVSGVYYPPSATKADKGIIGLALLHTQGAAPKELVSYYALSVLTHELIHDLQFRGAYYEGTNGIPPTAYDKERIGAWKQLNAFAKEADPQTKYNLLKIAAHSMIPPEFLYQNEKIHPIIDGNLRYGAGLQGYSSVGRPYEFVNTFAQLVGAGMITGGNKFKVDPDEMFRYLPEEASLFAKGFYRDMHDVLDGVTSSNWTSGKLASGPKIATYEPKEYFGLFKDLVDMTHKVVMSKEPTASIHRASQLMAALDAGTTANWTGPKMPSKEGIEDADFTSIHAAFNTAQMLLFGPDPGAAVTAMAPQTASGIKPPTPPKNPVQLTFPFNDEKGKPYGSAPVNLGWFWQRAPLFMQTLQHLSTRGIPLASDVMGAVKDIEPAQTRLAMGALASFMTKDGKFDASNPTLNMEPGSAVRDAFNKIVNWQQRNKAQAFDQDDKTKEWKLSDKAEKDLGSTITNGKADLPTLIGAVQNVTATHQVLGEQLLQDRVDSGASRVARMIMAIEPQIPYDQAKIAGTNVVRGLMNPTDPKSRFQVIQGVQGLRDQTRDSVLALAGSGIVDALQALQKQLSTNDWFATEQRPGKYLVESYKDGVRHVDGAQTNFAAKVKAQEIRNLGHTDVNVISKDDKYTGDFSAPESILQHYIDVERQAQERYLTQNPNNLSPEQIEQIRTYAPTPGSGVERMIERKGTNKYLIRRQDVPTALGHDYLDNMRDYISRLSSTIARNSIQRKVDLIHADSRLNGQDQFKNYVNDNIKASMVPTGTVERSLRATAAAYFLAGNLSSTIVIGSHGLQTLPETLTKFDTKGGWVGSAVNHLFSGINDLTYLTSSTNAKERGVLEKSAQAKLNAGVAMTPQEMKVLAFKKAVDEKILDVGVFQGLTHDDDVRAMMARNFGVGDQVSSGKGTLLADGLYRASKFGMALHGFASGFNNKVGFLAGLNQAIEQGKSFDEAYKHADNLRVQALFGGGKVNAPGYMAKYGNENSIPVMRSMYTLQRYTTGFMGRYMEHATDVISNDPNLSSGQRVQAGKSFMTLLATQLALGGLMGLPGVAAALALLEKKGVNAQAAVRESIAHLAGADQDNSGFRGLLTETAMNGLPNQMFGVNIGPRLGVTDYMGTSAYDGFNLSDLAGPTGSLVSNMYNGLGYLAQGQAQKGITTLAPNVVKRPIDMAMTKLKFGDFGFRDPQGEKMYDPSTADLLKYAGGLNPSTLTERQNLRRLVSQSDTNFQRQQGQRLDEAAGALQQGNHQPAAQWAQQQVRTGATSDPIGAIRHVADHAAQMGRVQDPLANVPAGNSSAATEIAQTFPKADLQQRSELDTVRSKIQMETQAGVPKNDYSKDISKAAVMDSLIKRQGMTRGQAERVVLMMGL